MFFVFGPSSIFAWGWKCGITLSRITKNKDPRRNPPTTGRKLSFPRFDDWSIAGNIKDQMLAATIIPPAKPRKIVFIFSDTLFLTKNIIAEPSDVAINIIEKPIII